MKKAAERRGTGRKTVNRLAVSSIRKNRSRSALIMLSVFLSTVLLTMISSYGMGLAKYEKASAEIQYGSFYGMFMDISEKQLDAVRKNEAFTDTGLMWDCGIVESGSNIGLAAVDDAAARLCAFGKRTEEGSLPEKENEIMADQGMLRALGYPDAKVGDRITLSFRPDMKSTYQEKSLVLSGILGGASDEDTGNGSYRGLVSPEFYRKYCGSGDGLCSVMFRMADDIALDSESAEDVIKGYAKECGISSSHVSVNTMYIMLSLSPGNEILMACIALTACVVLFSMIVIYNIFQVSLVRRMHEYGRIKAVGATGRQLKRMISREGMALRCRLFRQALQPGTLSHIYPLTG